MNSGRGAPTPARALNAEGIPNHFPHGTGRKGVAIEAGEREQRDCFGRLGRWRDGEHASSRVVGRVPSGRPSRRTVSVPLG